MSEEELARLHKSLSVPVRLRILKLIACRPLCVNAITRRLEISQPAVSQHLAVLRQAGLVKGDKHGYMVHYTLNRDRLKELRDAMAGFPEHTAQGPASVRLETEA
jgi:DNA-binding transcriptional ArsR family regulator